MNFLLSPVLVSGAMFQGLYCMVVGDAAFNHKNAMKNKPSPFKILDKLIESPLKTNGWKLETHAQKIVVCRCFLLSSLHVSSGGSCSVVPGSCWTRISWDGKVLRESDSDISTPVHTQVGFLTYPLNYDLVFASRLDDSFQCPLVCSLKFSTHDS